MTTERNAQGVDGLAEVMALLEKATPGEWNAEGDAVSAHHVAADPRLQYWVIDEANGDRRALACVGRPTDNASAIAAAVNYLRSHGAAIQVLVRFAEGRVRHRNYGDCPDEIEGHNSRDAGCKVCAALRQVEGQ